VYNVQRQGSFPPPNRQKEAGNINSSLLVLGRCIKAIRYVDSTSVADPGIIIPDPDFCPSRIPNLGSPLIQKKYLTNRGVKKICCPFVSTKITKWKIIFFNWGRKKFGPINKEL
jgi:hypothetical protein